MKIMTLLVTLALSAFAAAGQIQFASYDSGSQILHMSVAFEGGLKEHNFELAWDSCQTVGGVQQTAATLLDSGWDDTGSVTQFVDLQFDLSGVTCKPAELTIHYGRFSRATLWIE